MFFCEFYEKYTMSDPENSNSDDSYRPEDEEDVSVMIRCIIRPWMATKIQGLLKSNQLVNICIVIRVEKYKNDSERKKSA